MFVRQRSKQPFGLLLFLLFLITQFGLSGGLFPDRVTAAPMQWPSDTLWEGGAQSNDFPGTAYPLGGQSISNPPATSLVANTTSPDFYNFTVYSGFLFQVLIEFNPYLALNISSGLEVNLTQHPSFVGDIDLELRAKNGTLLGESKGFGSEEAIGPITTNVGPNPELWTINVTVVKPPIGYDTLDYSLIYDLHIIYDDQWEWLQSNDEVTSLDDPTDGASDDEIVPGVYKNLRFSSDTVTEYGDNDWYILWFYNDTAVAITVDSYTDTSGAELSGPDIGIFNLTSALNGTSPFVQFVDPGTSSSSLLTFRTNYTGWYYLNINNTRLSTANFYDLTIDIEDGIEVDFGSRSGNNTVKIDTPGGRYLPGMVISQSNGDWYNVTIKQKERLFVQVEWYPALISEMNLTVYENSSVQSELDAALPVAGLPFGQSGLGIGPHRADSDSNYLIHVEASNQYPRYYDLTVNVGGVDDDLEDNDNSGNPTDLSPSNYTFAPTIVDPFAGLVSLQGDPDWFRIPLQKNDNLSLQIDFDGTLGNLEMELYGIFGEALPPIAVSKQNPSNSEFIQFNVQVSGDYIFRVFADGILVNGFSDYNLTVTVFVKDDRFEVNNDFGEAAPIAEGIFDNLIIREDDDWFYVYLAATDEINVSLDYFPEPFGQINWLTDIDLDLLFDDQSSAAKSHSPVQNESITFQAPSSGKYFIVVHSDGPFNYYNLTISIGETDDIYEDNDNLKDATRITVVDEVLDTAVSYTESGLVIRVMDDDYFVVKVPAGQAIIVEITYQTGESLGLDILYPNGSFMATANELRPGSLQSQPETINTSYIGEHNTSDLYFRVSMDIGLVTSYDLNVTVGPVELLYTRQTVPPLTTSVPLPPPDPLLILITTAVVLGGGAAVLLYVGNKTGYLEKGVNKIKNILGKSGIEGDIEGGNGGGNGGNGD